MSVRREAGPEVQPDRPCGVPSGETGGGGPALVAPLARDIDLSRFELVAPVTMDDLAYVRSEIVAELGGWSSVEVHLDHAKPPRPCVIVDVRWPDRSRIYRELAITPAP